jgi:hypothetical protein
MELLMTSWRGLLALAFLAGTAEAGDWHYAIGVHDFTVPQVDSDTFGINGRATLDRHNASGRHYFGTLDVFVDHDKDHLDPDHIPVWWEMYAGTDGTFWESGDAHLGWLADVDTRANTASSVERRIMAMPWVVGTYEGEHFRASAKTGAGWFFLEIDDDVPKTRGYVRDNLRNSLLAYSVAADARLHIGDSWSLSGSAQEWWDSDRSLQTEFTAALTFNTDRWHKGSELVLNADYNEYNLEPYQQSGLPAILPWDHDLMFRVMLDNTW